MIIRTAAHQTIDNSKLNQYFVNLISNYLDDSINQDSFENYKEEILIKEYLKLWQRITLITHYVKKLFSQFEQNLKENYGESESYASVGLRVIRDSFMPKIIEKLTYTVV
jgi:hypothetical protein